ENLAVEYKISQEQVDEFSVSSQKRWAAAQEGGRFTQELTPIEIKTKKGVTLFDKDEHPRPDTNAEAFKKLPRTFKKDGVIHAGAASGICDGAASTVMATRTWAEKKGLKPMGKLVSWASAGCDP